MTGSESRRGKRVRCRIYDDAAPQGYEMTSSNLYIKDAPIIHPEKVNYKFSDEFIDQIIEESIELLKECGEQFFEDMCNFKDPKFKEGEGMDKQEFEKEVNHPDRYCDKVECINAMRFLFDDRVALDFCICNTFKYLWRRGKKTNADDTEERDIRKALWYFDKAKEIINGDMAFEINKAIELRGGKDD